MSSALSRPDRPCAGRRFFSSHRPVRLAVVTAAAALGMTLAGCSATTGPTSSDATSSASASSSSASASAGGSASTTATASSPVAAPTSASPAVPVTVAATPASGAAEVNPATPVTVKAAHGTVQKVSLTAADGTAVAGTTAGDGTTWTSSGRLAFNTAYTLTYTTADAAGAARTGSQQFSTVATQNEADAAIYPTAAMKTVGVGQPLQFTFSEPVTNRDAVEKAISITSTSGQQGDFHWYSDTLVRYRPQEYWKDNSTVTIDAKLFGVDLGNGQIGNQDYKRTIRIGDARIAVADNTTKRMVVTVNGKQAGSWPITLGNDDWRSTYGTKVIMEQYATTQFNAGTLGLKPGDPHYYPPLTVHNASRLSKSGEFIHQALPSAQPYLGVANVSHGCIGMPPEGASWVYQHMTAGDPVTIKNTGYGPMPSTDGFGDWDVPWSSWAN